MQAEQDDLKWVEESARTVVKYAKGKTIVVEKSTIPVRTAELIKCILDTSIDKGSGEKKNFRFYQTLNFYLRVMQLWIWKILIEF